MHPLGVGTSSVSDMHFSSEAGAPLFVIFWETSL